VGLFLGWPFCVVLTLPLAIDIIYRSGFFRVLIWGIYSIFLFLAPMVAVDYYYYKKILIAPLNIIIYNVFSSSGGPELYGVEPWTYYFFNGFLNFNLIFVLALLSLPIIILGNVRKGTNGPKLDVLVYIAPMYLWLSLMLKMAHKEERFLFVIYHVICVSGALSLVIIEEESLKILAKIFPKKTKIVTIGKMIHVMVWLLFMVIGLLCISRVVSLTVNYNAPLHAYHHLYDQEFQGGHRLQPSIDGKPINEYKICSGKEWYRFPSNFFLPSSKFQLNFVESSFTGQLPKPYSTSKNGTWIIPTDMNDLNKQEMSRYVNLSQCHYLVDFEFPSQSEPFYSQMTEWETIAQYPFLDAENSNKFLRAFYVPTLSPKYCTYRPYRVLKNKKLLKSNGNLP